MKSKIVFFSTSSRPLNVLEKLNLEFDIKLIVTKSDKQIGRNKNLVPNEIKKFALTHNIPLFEIDKFDLNTKAKLEIALNEANPDLALTIDFGFIVPKSLFNIPKNGIVNTHFSLLPKYRGASAVQFAILNDEKEFGITYHLIDANLDTGDIIYQSKFPLDENLTSGEAYEYLFNKCSEEITQILTKYVSKELLPIPQDHSKAVYTYSTSNPKHTFIFKEDAVLKSEDTERSVFRKIKAYNPWPLLRVEIGELQKFKQFSNLKPKKAEKIFLKINQANFSNNKLEITEVTIENGKRLNIKDFISGYFN